MAEVAETANVGASRGPRPIGRESDPPVGGNRYNELSSNWASVECERFRDLTRA